MHSSIDHLLVFVCLASALPQLPAALVCQNGGTYSLVLDACICTPQAYGTLCETLFSASNPCSNLSTLPVIRDPTAAHAAGKTTACSTDCVDFSVLTLSWYRVESPSGNYLVSNKPCSTSTVIGCGTTAPFTLRNFYTESNNVPGSLQTASAFQYNTAFTSCYDSNSVSYTVRVLRCLSNDTVYFMGPTATSSQRYCIGDWNPTTTTSTTALTSTIPTTTTMTTSTSTTTPNTTPITTTTTPSTTTTTTSTTTTSGMNINRSEWNNLVNSSHPRFKVNLDDVAGSNVSDLTCGIRSNSALTSLRWEMPLEWSTDAVPVASCNFSDVMLWLSKNDRVYINCVMELMNGTQTILSTREVTAFQVQFHGRAVRCLENRGQCVPDGFPDDSGSFRPSSWNQWFGVGWDSAMALSYRWTASAVLMLVAAIVLAMAWMH